MKKSVKLFTCLIVGLAAAIACLSPENMVKQAETIKVTCEPSILEVVAGEINAEVTVTYPADFFHPQAILEVTPVIVYEGGEVKGKVFTYQGEKVKDNYAVVPLTGQTIKEKLTFEYVSGMEKSYLELRGVVKCNGKSLNLPSKKVADGCNTTYMLARKEGRISYKKDDYQDVLYQTAEGQILYNVNSYNVRSSELKSKSIKDFKAALKEIRENARKTLTGTEIVAYASPEGKESFNNRLSLNRSKSANKAWKSVDGKKSAEKPEIKSVGEDWEGFQELVKNSNIEDKDLIIRVLSMYSEPSLREKEIRNMSAIYNTLKKEVLPKLRRARFIANVEFKNYSNEELVELLESDNTSVLDEEALLRAASLVKDLSKKELIYNKAISDFESDRAQFNLAVVKFNQGDYAIAKEEFLKVKNHDADLENALGVIAYHEGNLEEAANHFAESNTEDARENQGLLELLSGKYSAAATTLSESNSFNSALAHTLSGELDKANSILEADPAPCASYLKAVIAARQGNPQAVNFFLKVAGEDKYFADKAVKDVEFAGFIN